jgi:L-lactate dehydrogenase complex protein LldF
MSSDFHHGVVKALDNDAVRGHLRKAMDSLIEKRRVLFPDADELASLRQRCMQIRANALSKLPELLEQLESRCEVQGIRVHWAETTEQANQIVLQILESHQVKSLVKGKSMVSEEMGLNHYLEDAGIECLESDLGEFIIQLAGETPLPHRHAGAAQVEAGDRRAVP